MLTCEELMVLSLLKRRLFTPIEIIADKIFDGDIERMLEFINLLVERKMVEHALNGRITIMTIGKKVTCSKKLGALI
jgi:hypothetical protein